MAALDWPELRKKIEKTEDEASELLQKSLGYLEQIDYKFEGIDKQKKKIIIKEELSDKYEENKFIIHYQTRCGNLMAQIELFEKLKDSVGFINFPTKLNMVKKKWDKDLQEQFDWMKDESAKPKNAFEKRCLDIFKTLKKPVEYQDFLRRLDDATMLLFLQDKYTRIAEEFQGSKNELDFKVQDSKAKNLKDWIDAGKPKPKSFAQIKEEVALGEESFLDESEDISIQEPKVGASKSKAATTQSASSSEAETKGKLADLVKDDDNLDDFFDEDVSETPSEPLRSQQEPSKLFTTAFDKEKNKNKEQSQETSTPTAKPDSSEPKDTRHKR